nr:hypothetical protein [Actinospica robiniae]
MAVRLADCEALEAPGDFRRLEAFDGSPYDVIAGAMLVPHADHDDRVQCAVGLAVAGAVEAVTVGASR